MAMLPADEAAVGTGNGVCDDARGLPPPAPVLVPATAAATGDVRAEEGTVAVVEGTPPPKPKPPATANLRYAGILASKSFANSAAIARCLSFRGAASDVAIAPRSSR